MRDQVFISYSHRDRELFEEFKTMLAPVLRNGALKVWDDTLIRPGARWQDEIQKALGFAKVAVLLVSPDFLASDFIAKNELPPLLQAAKKDGATLFWICLSSCLIQHTEIAQFQAAHDISQPLDQLEKPERRKVFSEICAKLIGIAADPLIAPPGEGVTPAKISSLTNSKPGTDKLAEIDNRLTAAKDAAKNGNFGAGLK